MAVFQGALPIRGGLAWLADPPHPESGMTFELKPKVNGREIGVVVPISGSRPEAYQRAKKMAQELSKTLHGIKFTVRVDRTDCIATGYEVTQDGHTVS